MRPRIVEHIAFWPLGIGQKMVHLMVRGKKTFILIERVDGAPTRISRRPFGNGTRYFVETQSLDPASLQRILARVHGCTPEEIEIRNHNPSHRNSSIYTGPAHYGDVRAQTRW